MVQQSIHGLVHIHRVSDEMHDSIPDRNDDSFGFRQQKQDQLRQPKTKTENQARKAGGLGRKISNPFRAPFDSINRGLSGLVRQSSSATFGNSDGRRKDRKGLFVWE